MADLPRIPAKRVTSVEPVAARDYADKYITALMFKREPSGRMPGTVALHAYDFDAKELSPDPAHVERFDIGDVWEEADRSPMFSNVMGGLIQVVFLMYQERMIKEDLATMEAGRDRDGKIVELQAVQAQLGVVEDPPPAYTGDQTIWAHPHQPDDGTPEV